MPVFGERQFRFASIIAISLSLWMLIGYFRSEGLLFGKTDAIKIKRDALVGESQSSQKIEIVGDTIDAGDLARKLRTKPIDINSADEDELIKLSGIGRTLAKRILVYRAKHGKFKSTDELKNVEGIGKKKLEKIKKLAIVK